VEAFNSSSQVSKYPIANAIRVILQSIPEDAEREGLLETPERVAKAYKELFSGYDQDPEEILSKQFKQDGQGKVAVKNIEFYSMCEHHMLPFFGTVDIEYIPNGKVVGLSKLPRLVQCFSRRLQIQENLTKQIADAIFDNLGCDWVSVRIRAEHFCMKMRGIQNQCSITETEYEKCKY
jgi:GTP cyclohydrolase IA